MDEDPRFDQDVNLFEDADWKDILDELTKKHGFMPDYLYNSILSKENSSSTSDSNSLNDAPASFNEDKTLHDDSSEDCGIVSPDLNRRSPGVDSGCSVGFNDDDDDDEMKMNSPYRRMDSAIEKIRNEMSDLRLMTIALTKRFIYAFDIIEDIKFLNENSSSRESLSGSINGSQEQLTPGSRRRKSHFKKLSQSVPVVRGTCPDVINRQNKKLSEDIKLQLFQKRIEGLNGYRCNSSMDSFAKLNETTGTERLRRSSGSEDSKAYSVKTAESTVLHRRSKSISYGQGNTDQWIENVQEIDRSSRNMEEFAELVRAETIEFDKYLSSTDTLNEGASLNTDEKEGKLSTKDPPIDLGDINVKLDEDVKLSEKNKAKVLLEKDRESVYEFIFDQSILGEEIAEGKSNPHISASTPCSPTFKSPGESPRKSWLHGEGRWSYNEKHEVKVPKKSSQKARSRSWSLEGREDNSSSVNDCEKNSNRSKDANSTTAKKEKPKTKPLTRSLTFQELTNMRKWKKSPPRQDDKFIANPVSPQYLKLMWMLEQENGTDL